MVSLVRSFEGGLSTYWRNGPMGISGRCLLTLSFDRGDGCLTRCTSFFFFFPQKSGKVVIVLAGRHAGKKAVVVKTFDEGNADKQFSHCLIAGIARGPRKVTRGMSKKKVEKRSRTMKPFVKYVNVRHVFPTRYVVDLDLKKAVDEADLVDAERKVDVKKNLKKLFEDRYLNQKAVTSEKKAVGSSYFFQKLRF
eukprot:CAMPEP_0195284238 /NCGR_PEP_ID=MMETSP0707-20130614/2507_1 /TAXON_ID=33640 /ORGANISM="Asterionellopsis glacialis, Strain CCMP134" /LENGTH=193 /DNA_ID=CAMNT_0040343555 /DNA_START=166 /DNA_END=747 /DNA_ORIENTATION=+